MGYLLEPSDASNAARRQGRSVRVGMRRLIGERAKGSLWLEYPLGEACGGKVENEPIFVARAINAPLKIGFLSPFASVPTEN